MKVWIILGIVIIGMVGVGAYIFYADTPFMQQLFEQPQVIEDVVAQTQVLGDKGIYITTDEAQWNHVLESGVEENLTFHTLNQKDKKTSLCWTLEDGKTLSDTTDRFLYDGGGTRIQDNKNKDIKLKYENSAQCGGIGYHIDLTTAAAVNINDYVKIGEQSSVVIYENTTLIDFIGDTFSFNSTLYKWVDGNWSNSNDIWATVYVNNETWKHGAEDNHSNGWEQYKYVYEAEKNNGVAFKQYGTSVYVGNDKEGYWIHPYKGEKIIEEIINDSNIKSETYGEFITLDKVIDSSLCNQFIITDDLINDTGEDSPTYGELINITLYADCSLTIYENENVSTFELTFWNNGSIDPLIEGSSSYDSGNINITDEGGWTHLETVSTAPYDDLVAYWGFDTDLINSDMVTGRVQGAIDFDGSNDHMYVSDDASLDFGTGDFAISLWVNTDTTASDQEVITKALDSGSFAGFTLRIIDNAECTGSGPVCFALWPYNSGGSRVTANLSGYDGISSNTWYHVVAQRKSSQIMIFVNGDVASANITNSVNVDNSQVLNIGEDQSGWTGSHFNGQLDELIIFNNSLTNSQIQNLYNDGLINKRSDITTDVSLHLPFDGTTKDLSINENHAVATNFNPTAYDYSPNNNDGSHINNAGVSYWNSYGGVTVLDGTDDYINLGNGVDVTVPYTLSAWIYWEHTGANHGGIIATEDDLSVYEGAWLLVRSDEAIQIAYGDGTGVGSTDRRTKASAAGVVNNSQWHHIVGVVRGATNMDIYVDGTDVGGSYSGTGGALSHDTASGSIGQWANKANHDFEGRIDEVMIFDDDLTSAEVLAIYNNQSARFKTEGDQTFSTINETVTGNRVNITVESFQNLTGSKVEASVGSWNDVQNVPYTIGEGNILYASFNVDTGYQDVIGRYNASQSSFDDPVNNSNGYYNQSIEVDGSSEFITFADISELNGNGEYSYAIWFKNDLTASSNRYVIDDTNSGTILDLSWPNDERYDCLANIGGLTRTVTSNNVYNTAGVWHFIVCRYDGSTFEINIDGGADVAQGSYTGNLGTSDPDLNVGGSTSVSESDGLLDEFMVWNRSITDEEIAMLYATGLTKIDGTGTGMNYTITSSKDIQSDGTVTGLSVAANGTHSFVHLDYYAGNSSNPFFTPIIAGDINYTFYTVEEAAGPDSCVYTSGTWNIDCSDACYINTTVELNGNELRFSGTGTITFNESGIINNVSYVYQPTSCYLYRLAPGGYNINV